MTGFKEDMMIVPSISTRAELVRRASEIVPTLQKHASWNEEHRRIHEESLQALEQAGVFRLRLPKRYGGYEVDARTLVEVLAELGQGDGSTAWVAWVLASNTWLVGLFPDVVQDQVFANPDVRSDKRDPGSDRQGGTWRGRLRLERPVALPLRFVTQPVERDGGDVYHS
jgi:alkylation response protein AidB-like acyl-CoA dehydrogenase